MFSITAITLCRARGHPTTLRCSNCCTRACCAKVVPSRRPTVLTGTTQAIYGAMESGTLTMACRRERCCWTSLRTE